MKIVTIILLSILIFGCSNRAVVKLGGSNHNIEIEDGIPKSEGEIVALFVVSKIDELRGKGISADAKLTHLKSISRWRTPGIPSEEEKNANTLQISIMVVLVMRFVLV